MNDSEAGAIQALGALWRESERKLYPLATTSPQKYEQVVLLAREVANALKSVKSVGALEQSWADHVAITQDTATAAGMALGDLPVDDVAGVAFSLRLGEIRASEHAQTQMLLVTEAISSGQSWVLLHEQGNLEAGLMDAYQSIEMHLGSGLTIVANAEMNHVNGGAMYVLQVIRLDPTTGAPVELDPGIAEISELDEIAEFTETRKKLREKIEAT